jgi:hypothetical protein
VSAAARRAVVMTVRAPDDLRISWVVRI